MNLAGKWRNALDKALAEIGFDQTCLFRVFSSDFATMLQVVM